MTYELAKELEDAGFPQGGYKQSFVIGRHDNGLEIIVSIATPTLEELIDACGKERLSLVFGDAYETWYVSKGVEHIESVHAEGASLSEAVARLWLELHPAKEA